MIHGVDTSFLVQVEVAGHPGHEQARGVLNRLLDEGGVLAVAPQVLAELIHVTTDARRFDRPLDMPTALARAKQWWGAADVFQAFPTERAVTLLHAWMHEHRLGRKRLLDTMLAATYCALGIESIVSSNARDFSVFGSFTLVVT